MISRYILFDITSGLPTVITTSIEAYEQYKVYGSVIAVGVDETNLTEDALIMSTWHWTGSSIGSHSEQSGDYWVWDIPTWSYIFIAPAPVINVGDYSTLSEYRKITVYGNAVDTYWTTSFPIQLRTNTVDNFATATIITEDMGGSYTADNIEVTSRYYYLTPYYLDDYYNQVFGTTVSTGSVIPLAVQTGDIGLGAVTGTKLASGTVNTQLAGTGVNVLNPRYTTFEEGVLPPFTTHASGTLSQDATAKYFGTKSLKIVTTGISGFWLSPNKVNNITPNKKWILSCYIYSDTIIAAPVWGSAGVHVGISTASGYYGTAGYDGNAAYGTLTIPAGTWTRIYGVLDLTADSNTTCDIRIDSHATGKNVWFDGIMLEAQVGNLITPSAYHEPPNFQNTYTGDLNATLGANFLNTYTIPTGTIPSSLTLTTGTSAATYTAGSGTLTKTGTLLGWNASGYSTNGFSGGAQVSFTTVAPSTGSYMVGLNSDPTTNADYSTLDYAIYIIGLNQRIYESGVQITRSGASNTYVVGDSFSVIYNGANLVNYYRNGILFYSSYVVTPITVPLYMDSSFLEYNTGCTNLKFNAYSAPVLLSGNNVVGVIHAGNADDHLSDNIISTKTVLPQSVSSIDLFSSDYDITLLEFDFTGSSTFYAGSLYITGDKYASTLVQVGLSNVQKTLTTFPVGISISLQSQYSIDNGMMSYNFTQEYEPISAGDNYQNYYQWYKTADYIVSFNAATAVNITTDVITTTASNFITGSEVILEYDWLDPTFVPIGGLSYGTSYFVIKLTSTTLKLAASFDDAKASIPIAVDLTSVGVSTHKIVSTFLTGQVYTNMPTRQFNVIPTSAGVNIATDTFTVSSTTPVWNTGIYTGMEVVYFNDALGVNIAPLVYGTSYYIIRVAATTFKLATTFANATAGVAINITAVSTGTLAHNFVGRFRWVLFNTGSDFNISTHSLIGDSQTKSTSILDIAFMGDRGENTYHLYMTFLLGSVTSVTALDPLTFSYVFSALTSKR